MGGATAIKLSEGLYAAMRGKLYAPFEAVVTAEEVSAYARSTEDDNPIRHDRDAARAADHADIIAPPTFLLALAAKRGQNANALGEFGFTSNHTLYGQQDFDCRRPVCVGETLHGRQRIVEVTEKKAGELLFVITEMEWLDARGEIVAVTRQTLIVPLRGEEAA